MLFLYHIIIFIITVFSPVIIFFRILKNKEDKKRYIEKFSISSKKRVKGKLIWFHGASVGEILSIVPLIKNYEKNNSISQILVTSSTLSSSKVLKKFKFKKTVHQFYPIDNLFLTNKFLKFWKPCMAVFVDSEIWPCMYNNINNQKIPLILLNARITKKTFKRWMTLRYFARSIFNKITIAYPQNLETARYLKILKANNISHLGNLKFAENFEENLERINVYLKKAFKKKKIWVASSTHRSEEVFCAKAHIQLKKKIKNLITIIIPRHIHRSDEIISEMKNLGLKVSQHSTKPRSLKNTDIYIVDTFGESKKFYKIASTVFVGGSMINRGGQNPLEPARYGTKILHGPNVGNFKEIYDYLNSLNISSKVKTPLEISNSFRLKKNMSNVKKIDIIGKNILKKTLKELNKSI